MLNHDFFIQAHQMLLAGQRYKEAVELCEYAIASAVWAPNMERQCGALCRWSLAETYFYQIGDAKKARNGYMNLLKFIDDDMSMLTIPSAPTMQEALEDMYVKACIDMGQLAVSYDEYFTYLHKSEAVRPLTQNQRAQMDSVEYNRSHGLSWSDNILQLAELESRSVESGAVDRLPCAMAMYSLFLIYPETDPPIDVLRIAINNYSSYVCQFIGESILRCAAKKHPANPDNYRFIFERAIELVGEFLDDMETHEAAKEAQNRLISARSESIDKSNFFNYGFASVAPPGVPDFVPPLIMKERIIQHLSAAGRAEPSKAGCLTTSVISMLSFGCMIAIVSFIINGLL